MMVSGDDFSFGALLQTLRRRRHLTQQVLAEALGVHRRTLVRWEQGDSLPGSKGLVLELARHLKLDDQETRRLLDVSLTVLAPAFLVPLPRNPFFTGREEILETLHTQLGINQAVALTRPLALYGLGGVGKTQVALEYVYRYALEYSAVFWIGAETEESIVSSLLRIAEVLQLPERDEKDLQCTVAAVKHWLSTHSQWLLIWDNVEDLTLLNRFLPSIRPGAILISTRCQALGTLAQGLDLLPMEQKEGMLFVLRRAKIVSPETTYGQMHQLAELRPAEYGAVSELVTLLGGLPLALDQAGAYIEETRCGLAGYLQHYQYQQRCLLEYRGALASDHLHSVAVTFRLLLERVEREQRAALDVLSMCAWLSVDAIPEEVFLEGAASLEPTLVSTLALNPLQFDQIMAFLGNLSLVQRQAETRTFSLHRLVQAVLKESLSAATQCHWRTCVLRALSQLFPSNERTDAHYWQQCQRLLPHALLFLTPDHLEPEEDALLIPLMIHVANYFSERSCYPEAEHLFQKAIQLGERAQGASSPHMSEAFHGLALLFWRQGNAAEAERLFQKVIHLEEQTPGVDHPQMSEALYRLASLYRDQGDYAEAEPLFQRAIHQAEQREGSDQLQVATSLQGLAVLYAEQWQFAQAEPLYQRALAIRTRILGPDHPQVAVLFHNQAEDYKEQGRYEEATSLLHRALGIWEQTLGPDHPRIAYPLVGLAEVAREQGRYEEATSLLHRALGIWEQTFGPDHPRVADVLNEFAGLFLVQDQDEQAEVLYQRALAIREHKMGPTHPTVASSLHGLATLSLKHAKHRVAQSFLVRALQIRERTLGHDHPRTADIIHDLAILEWKRGNLDEATLRAEHALHIRSQALGECHPHTVATRELYAHLVQAQACAKIEVASEQGPEAIPDSHRNERQENGVSSPLSEAASPVPSQDDPLQGFLDACCERHSLAWCRSADLWQAYTSWATNHQERFLLSRRAFAAHLQALGCQADRTNTARIWRGIALRSSNP